MHPPDSLAAAPLHTTTAPAPLQPHSTHPPPAFVQDGAELVLHLAAVVHQRGAHTVSQGAAHTVERADLLLSKEVSYRSNRLEKHRASPTPAPRQPHAGPTPARCQPHASLTNRHGVAVPVRCAAP